MDWKEFFKPNLAKIILFIILFAFFTFLPTGFIKDIMSSFKVFPQIHSLGLPISFYDQRLCYSTWVIGHETVNCPYAFSIIKLLVDVAFWYLISTLIIQSIYKIQK